MKYSVLQNVIYLYKTIINSVCPDQEVFSIVSPYNKSDILIIHHHNHKNTLKKHFIFNPFGTGTHSHFYLLFVDFYHSLLPQY